MRVVLDTNCVVSGMLWFGPPRRVLELARAGKVSIFASIALLEELAGTLAYPRFARQIEQMSLNVEQLVREYGAMVSLVRPASTGIPALADPDDEAVLACALGAAAQAVVSGDRHLLDLGQFSGIPILTPAAFLDLLSAQE
jgi:putative PIN family toxin of toxin-antitoxin system